MKLRISSLDKEIADALKASAPVNVTVEVVPVMRFTENLPNVYEAVVTVTTAVSALLPVAKWLTEQLGKSKNNTVTINGNQTNINQVVIHNYIVNNFESGNERTDDLKQ